MWSPAIAALLTLRITGGGYTSIGWRWPSARFVALSCMIPIVYIGVTYAVGSVLGGGDYFPNARFIDATRTSFGFAGFPTWLVIPAYLIVNGVTRIVTETATALGEEIGWRGFLVPALAKRFGFVSVSLISGVIWGMWHFPLIFIGQPFNEENIIGAVCLLGALTGVSFAMTWLRLRSGSVSIAALFHSTHNVFNGIANALIIPNAKTPVLLDETGLVMPAVDRWWPSRSAASASFWSTFRRATIDVDPDINHIHIS